MSSDNEQIALAVTPAGAGGGDPSPLPLSDARLEKIAAYVVDPWPTPDWPSMVMGMLRDLLAEVARLRAELAPLREMLDRYCSELPQPVHLPVGRPALLAALIADWRRLRYERADNRDRNAVLHQTVAELRAEVERLECLIAGWGASGKVDPADALAAIDPRRGRGVPR